ncbi:MAG: permease of phosphate ABC transporter [Eubacteriaceae bacterium]|nr:permease of phosphate ABC transporter [Eubacteriaceae bacterium]
MKKLFELGNRYAAKSTWIDFALIKFCLFSMGLAAGLFISDAHRKTALICAACVFAVTYVILMTKVVRIAGEMIRERKD